MNNECREMARYINKPRCGSMNKYECDGCSDKIVCSEKDVK